MLKYKIPQIVTLTLLNPPGLSGEPIKPGSMYYDPFYDRIRYHSECWREHYCSYCDHHDKHHRKHYKKHKRHKHHKWHDDDDDWDDDDEDD